MFRQEYWNWTWDDLVVHDLPAIIDFIYQKTGQKTHYVGHSMVVFLRNLEFLHCIMPILLFGLRKNKHGCYFSWTGYFDSFGIIF